MGCAPAKKPKESKIGGEEKKKSETEEKNPEIIIPGNSATVIASTVNPQASNAKKDNSGTKTFTIIGDNLVNLGGAFKLVAKAKTKSNTYVLGETQHKKGESSNQVKQEFSLGPVPKEEHDDVEFKLEFHYEDGNVYKYKAKIKPGNKVTKKDFGVTFDLGLA
jgi:hypothetical protein